MQGDKPWVIYALKDPQSGEVRYVGQTIDGARRYRGHLTASQWTQSHKDRWLRKLSALGLKPTLEILESGAGDVAEAERRWIRLKREQGCRLTNSTDGGDGAPGMIVSPETRAKQSAKRKGKPIHTAESRAKIAAAGKGRPASQAVMEHIRKLNLGKPHSEEHRRKLSKPRSPDARLKIAQLNRERFTGRVLDAEHRAKISEGNKGKIVSDESRARISAGKVGKPLSEEHCASLSRAQAKRFTETPVTSETRAKITAKLTGRPVSLETRAKIAASLRGQAGRSVGKETREQIAATLRGKPKSEEHKQALKAAWVARRGKSNSSGQSIEGGDLRTGEHGGSGLCNAAF